jgi:intracellular multiplication protein IcmL
MTDKPRKRPVQKKQAVKNSSSTKKMNSNSASKSSESQRPVVEDVIATKMLRDANVRQKVLFMNRIAIASVIALFFSIATNVFLFTKAPDIKYFLADSEGKIKEMVAIDEPIQSVNEVLSWTSDSITKAYTFSFANYRQELQSVRPSFTTSGWQGFERALEESGNLKAVIENMFVTTAVPRGAPVIVSEGLVNGRYAWRVEVPIVVTYQSANTRTTQDLLVTAIVVRRTELEHPRGLGISQLIAE